MALTKIKCTVENDPYRGVVDIKITSNTDSISGFDTIVIKRKSKRLDETESEIFKVSDITDVKQLNFGVLDITSVSGETYDYSIYLTSGDEFSYLEMQKYEDIEVWFNGLFVGDMYDSSKQYIAGSNFYTGTKRNTEVEYVTTLSSRLPYRISNAETNYTTGSSKGLFLKTTPNKKKFELDSYTVYLREILDFLSDGNTKVLKTHDGRIWYISIDEAITEENESGFEGRYNVSFDWTEIEEALSTNGIGVAYSYE